MNTVCGGLPQLQSTCQKLLCYMQMGGAKAVDKSEVWRITMQPLHGLYMHCQPRAPVESPAKAQQAGGAVSPDVQG